LIEILRANPWLLIVLTALSIPIFGIILGAWSQFLWHGSRRAAYDAIRAYAQQGKEPPPELLAAVSGWRGRRGWERGRHRRWAESAADDATDASGEAFSPGEAIHREFEFYAEHRRRDAPMRTWRRAFTYGALAGGLYLASEISTTAGTQHGFLIAAVIVGAVAVATFLSAILVTLFRDQKK